MDITHIIKFLKKSRESISDLDKKRLGKSGFYYVIDLDGVVVYHPQGLLIGRNFRDYWFIKIILEEKSGCIKYEMGEKEQTVYYRQLNETEILCLSIMSEEVKDNASNCETRKKANDSRPIE